MNIALVSLDQIWEDKKANLLLCEEYIQKASTQRLDLVVFPEMTLTGFSIDSLANAEDEQISYTIKEFQYLSSKYNIGILFGVVIKDDNKAQNKAILVDKNGEILGKYSKIHPFSFSGENKYFNSGSEICIIEFENMNIGLTICYDLRFPEIYASLAKKSDMIINIANWPAKRVEHWNTLLRARAIENQTYIVGVNRIGVDNNNLEYIESTNTFNANGRKLKFKSYKNMKIYNIEKKWTKKFKRKFNTTDDRKIELYKGIL